MSKTRVAVSSLVVLAMSLTACSRAPKTVEIPRASEAPLVAPSGSPSIFQPGTVPSREVQVPSDPGAGWGSPSPAVPSAAPTPSPSPSALLPAPDIREAGSKVTAEIGGTKIKVPLKTVVGEPVYIPPTGALKITWTDFEGNTLVIGATHMADGGGNRRPPDLGFELTLARPQTEVFSSSGGKCRVTLTTIRLKELEGEFTCRRNQGDQGTVIDVSGRFFVRF